MPGRAGRRSVERHAAARLEGQAGRRVDDRVGDLDAQASDRVDQVDEALRLEGDVVLDRDARRPFDAVDERLGVTLEERAVDARAGLLVVQVAWDGEEAGAGLVEAEDGDRVGAGAVRHARIRADEEDVGRTVGRPLGGDRDPVDGVVAPVDVDRTGAHGADGHTTADMPATARRRRRAEDLATTADAVAERGPGPEVHRVVKALEHRAPPHRPARRDRRGPAAAGRWPGGRAA